jgi:membrane protein implicated in regulation of membrane protease activity
MTDFIVNFLALLGIALIVGGVALVSIPAALVVGGVALLVLAFVIERAADERDKRAAR